MLVVSVSVSGSTPRNCRISGPKTVEKNVRLNQPIFFEFKKIKNPRFLGFFVSKQYFGIGRFKGTFLSHLSTGKLRENMKKFLLSFLFLVVGIAYADNTITSKEYVDGQVADLQTQIPAKNVNTLVMNTGTAGTIGEKAIYDTTGTYAEQQDALVTAGAFNSAVQNALESEFVCVEWQGSVHDNAHCLLYEVRGATQTQSPNLLCSPTNISSATFDPATGVFTNIQAEPKNYVEFNIQFKNVYDRIYHMSTYVFNASQVFKNTFTTQEDTKALRLKHNGSSFDIDIYFPVEPSTTYTLLVNAIETNPSVVGGMKLQLMLVQGEYDSDVFIPCGNVYLP